MTTHQTTFTRLEAGSRRRSQNLSDIMNSPDIAREKWLFVTPHDDDMVMGGGLWCQAAIAAGVDVHFLVVTDGRMGYCSEEQRPTIARIRKEELIESCLLLGMKRENIHFGGYPDGGLTILQGRRKAEPGENDIKGYIGIQNLYTWHLRQIRPARVFVPSPMDIHPDHQVVHNELMICLFHAAGSIWPELGPVLEQVPMIYEMAIYCDFSDAPNLEIHSDAALFETKMKAIASYRSQKQIDMAVQSAREGGPYEYLREIKFKFYSPTIYRKLFE